jgi:hypothetical protein
LEVVFEEGAGVLEVLFGVGFGGGDALERVVEDADDLPLLWEGRPRELKILDLPATDMRNAKARLDPENMMGEGFGTNEIEQESTVKTITYAQPRHPLYQKARQIL